MPYSVEETGSLTRTASVEIPAAEYQQSVDKELRKLAGRVKIRGFRKGKIPLPVLRQKYGSAVQQDVIQSIVNTYVDQIVKEAQNVLFIDQPKVTNFQADGVGLAFEVEFEVRPDVDPIGYLGMSVERPRVDIEDSAIDEELEKLREQYSSLEPIEKRKKIKEGDVVTFDFEALDKEDADLADFKGEGAQITVGQGNALPGMDDALEGAAFDATVTATIEPGDGYQVEKLRGKKFDVELTVTSVKQRVLPALDDDFAADTGQAETLSELRDQVRERLEHEKAHSAGHFAENDMMERLIDENDFELPPLFVRQQIDNKINQQLQQLGQQGLDIKNLNLDVENIREELRAETEEQLRAEFLLLAIAEKEKLQVTDEDMANFFQHQAMHMNASADQVRRFYQQDRNRWQQAAGSALLEKTVNFLLEKADIKEIEWPSDDELQAREEARKAKTEKTAKKSAPKKAKSEKKAKAEAPKAEKAEKPAKEEKAPKAEKKAAKADSGADDKAAFSAMTVSDLKDKLRDADLPVSGKKAELIDRLIEAGIKP